MKGGWRDTVIAVTISLLIGAVGGVKLFGSDVLSTEEVRSLARQENAGLTQSVLELKSSVSQLTISVNALTVQVNSLQSAVRGAR